MGKCESGSLVTVQFVFSSIGVLLAFFSRLINAEFSVLFSFLLTFYLDSANRMPKELEIGILLAFSLILSLSGIFGLIQ